MAKTKYPGVTEYPTKTGKKRYIAQVRHRGALQKNISKSFTCASDAHKWKVEMQLDIERGRFKGTEVQRHTVGKLIDRFISKELPKSPKGQAKQTALLTWWKGRLGHLLLSELTRPVISDARDVLLDGTTVRKSKRSPATVNRYLAALSKALTVAVKEWEWLEENPMRKMSRPKEGQGRDRYLSLEEKPRLREACKADPNPYLYPIVELALLTGMRRGEILSLQWEDIDYQAQEIILRQTKNGERRLISLIPPLEAILDVCRQFSGGRGLIFPPRRLGSDTADITTAFKRACKKAGISNFRFHDLRHTAASYMAMDGGATQGELMAILGHKSPQMTRRYAHYSRRHLAEVMSRAASKHVEAQPASEQDDS